MVKLQEIRDRLEKGMRVSVTLKVANGVVKRREGTVVDVKRGAASVRFENEVNPRTVRFNEIEIPEPTKAAPAKPPVRLAVVESAPALPAKADVPERASFQAWLDMGEEVENDLEESVALLRVEKAGLEEEHAVIGQQLDAVTTRYSEMHKALETIRAIRRAR